MNKSQITQYYDAVVKALDCRRVTDAIDLLTSMAGQGADVAVRDRIFRLESAYGYLAKYALDGVVDPQRNQVFDDIKAEILETADTLRRDVLSNDDSSQYLSTLRREHYQGVTLASIIEKWNEAISQASLSSLAGHIDQTAAKATEALERQLFDHVWTLFPMTHDDEAALVSLLDSPATPQRVKLLAVSAVALGEIEYHDERRLSLLMDVYMKGDDALAMRALAGIVAGMWQHRARPWHKRLIDKFEAMAEMPSWNADIREAILQFIRTRDTERIDRKIRNELMPGLMKMRPEIEKEMKRSPESLDDLTSIEENPEWQEILDKSGISDKLKEISEIQEDGGDVMMTTFSNLKSFPFFREISNWFLPFDAERSDIMSLATDDDNKSIVTLSRMIESLPFLCDNDKYSLIFSLSSMPEAQRRMMMSQMNAQGDMMAKMQAASIVTGAVARHQHLAMYMQSLYRFYKLYRRKSEFVDIFGMAINPAAVKHLRSVFDDTDFLSLVAEFYFKREYYPEALQLMQLRATLLKPTAQDYQKMGFAMQQMGDVDGAIAMYEKSEMLNPQSVWTLRRLSACYRQVGKPQKAFQCLERVIEQRPDDINVMLQMGHCQLLMGNVDKALKIYFKAEYLRPDSLKVIRPLAWTLLISGDGERARTYYKRILDAKPGDNDLLNVAHLDMIEGKYSDAISRYKQVLDNKGDDFNALFEADLGHIYSAGADPLMVGLVMERVFAGTHKPGPRLDPPS